MQEYKMQLGDLIGVGVTFVVAALVLAFGLQILSDVNDDMTNNSLESNATEDAMTGLSNITGKFPILGTITVAVIIIGLLITYFANKR